MRFELNQHCLTLCMLYLICALCSGCGAAALSVAGSGASLATSYTLNGIVHRTFNLPSNHVQKAAILALDNMNIKTEIPLVQPKKNQNIEQMIIGRAGNRVIQINLESITPTLTRMEVSARIHPIFMDKATAQEVVEQTAINLKANRS